MLNLMHVVVSRDGLRHSFYEKKRLIFVIEYSDEAIIRTMKKLLIYHTFMENLKQHKTDAPTQSSVLQINRGQKADIFCYFYGFDQAKDNGFVHYHFPHRFRDKQHILNTWKFIRSNYLLENEQWQIIPDDLNDTRIN